MKGKIGFVIAVVAAVLFGYFCADIVFQRYQKKDSVFSEGTNMYFLQQGVYTKEDSIEKNIKKLSQSITVSEDGKYYVYIGMTASKEQAEKIQKIYRDQNIELYIREEKLNNHEFLNEVEQYDILLEASKTEAEVNSVLKTVLATYEEIVLKK